MKNIKLHFKYIHIPFTIDSFNTILYILLRIFSGICPLLYIVFYGQFIDNILKLYNNNIMYDKLISSFVGIFLISLFTYFNENLTGYIFCKLQNNVLIKLKVKCLDKISVLKYEFIEDKDTRDLINRVSIDMPVQILKGFLNLFELIELVIKIISITTVISAFSLTYACVTLIVFIPVIYVSIWAGKKDYKAFVKYQKVNRFVTNYSNVLTSKEYADERKIYNYTNWMIKKWEHYYTKSKNMFLNVKKKNYFKVKTNSIIINSVFLLIIGLLIKLCLENKISIGYFTSTTTQIYKLGATIAWSLCTIVYQLANSNNYMQDYISFYNLKEKKSNKVSKTIKKIDTIEFRNVKFKYPNTNNYVLKGVSFKLNSNENYAFVGENGTGKTTIIKLILKMYDNYEGEILFNNINLRYIKDVSNLFSVMFQDYAKYQVSIKDNILFGKNEKNNKINSLLKKIGFSVKSKNLYNGINTELGRLSNKNIDLSIGQWQKLAMVRALMQKGKFYILDEPTAALDPIVESTVYNDFINILTSKYNNVHSSAIIITHRLGAARLANKILVIADGVVKEFGTHKKLIENEGLYCKMYNIQKEWYVDEYYA